jgi:hypothetical protein
MPVSCHSLYHSPSQTSLSSVYLPPAHLFGNYCINECRVFLKGTDRLLVLHTETKNVHINISPNVLFLSYSQKDASTEHVQSVLHEIQCMLGCVLAWTAKSVQV